MLPGGKDGGWVTLTTLPPSCVDCLEILGNSAFWSPKGLSKPLQEKLYLLCVPVMNELLAHHRAHKFWSSAVSWARRKPLHYLIFHPLKLELSTRIKYTYYLLICTRIYHSVFSPFVLWLKFCLYLSSSSRNPQHSFSLHPATFDHANNIWPKVLIRKSFVTLKLGRCGRNSSGSEEALVVRSCVILVFH